MISVTSKTSSLTSDDAMLNMHHVVAARTARDNVRTIRHKYLARLAAVRLAKKQAAQQAAKQAAKQAAQQAAAQPTPAPSPAASSTSSGSDPRPFLARSLHPQRRRGRELRLGTR